LQEEISAQAGPLEKPSSLFVDRDFMRVWLAGGMVGVMRWMDVLVVGYYTVQITGSALITAQMLFLRMLPMFLLGAFCGAWAERFDRRFLLVTLMVSMTAMYSSLAGLAFIERLELWHVAIGVTLSGVFWSFELPVRRTMVGDIAGPARLPRAMGLESATNSMTRASGAFIGGALLDFAGIQGPFGFGACVCFIGACLIIGVQRGIRSEGIGGEPVLKSLAAGLHYIRQERVIQAVLVVTIILNLFGFACVSMLPVIGRQNFEMSALQTGMLTSLEGLGALCGATLVAAFARPSQLARIFAIGAGTYISSMGLFASMGWLGGTTLIFLAGGFLFIAGFGLSGFGSMQSGLILARAPSNMRVRVMGVLAMCIGCGPIGILNVGWIAETVGDAAIAVITVTSIGFFCYLIANFLYPELRRRLT
jgi:MFS family permease